MGFCYFCCMSTHDTPTILTEISQGVATIWLNRPEKFNSFNRQMALELQEVLDHAAHASEVRAVVLSGKGKAFCAGQDLSEAIDPDGPGITRIVSEHYNPIIMKLRYLPKPVIGVVNGVAAGAGANIALACDITLAATSASFIQAFSKIGLIPDSGGTFFLPRLVGMQRAALQMFTGDKVSASEAAAMGMIAQVHADDQLWDAAMSLAQRLAQMPTQAIAYTKQLLNEGTHNRLDQQLSQEGEWQARAAETHDYQEGVAAFLGKRPPLFSGK